MRHVRVSGMVALVPATSVMLLLRRVGLAVAAVGVVLCLASCGGVASPTVRARDNLIRSDPENGKTTITVGSKNFSEEFILGQIYAQALRAAGFRVKTRLNLGSEKVAVKAIKDGRISGYPEYTSTALGSFFGVPASRIPTDAGRAYREAKARLAREGIVALAPTPFADSNAVGMLTTSARKLGVKDISDLSGKSGNLVLAGSPECRSRSDCLAGLQSDYGLGFKRFRPMAIGRRYAALDNRQADLSILFTSDARLATSGKYTILRDDKGLIPAGNVTFLASKQAADRAGHDFAATIEKVQGNLTLPVIQALNARVDIGKQDPAAVAHQYLKALGYVR